MAKTQKVLSLSPTAHDLLSRQQNASAFVSELIEANHAAVLNAHFSLVGSGEWREREILALCDILNGSMVFELGANGVGLSQFLELEMRDVARLMPEILEKWEVTSDEWEACIKRASREAQAYLLWMIVKSFWMGDTFIRDRLSKATE